MIALAAVAEERIAVFVPSARTAGEMEKTLSADKALGRLKPVVFGKYTDFVTALQAEQVPVLIVPASFTEGRTDYQPALQFTSRGKDTFQFLLLSLGGKWDAAATKDGVLGVVEEGERGHAKVFVDRILGGKTFKALKRVTKIDDLMPLLALGNADYVLIPEGSLAALKERYTTPVVVVDKSAAVPFPVVAVRSGGKADGAQALKGMNAASLAALGFDGLREISKGRQGK